MRTDRRTDRQTREVNSLFRNFANAARYCIQFGKMTALVDVPLRRDRNYYYYYYYY